VIFFFFSPEHKRKCLSSEKHQIGRQSVLVMRPFEMPGAWDWEESGHGHVVCVQYSAMLEEHAVNNVEH